MPLTDAEAKAILANPKKWPERSSTKKWPIPGHKGRWMRLCPSPNAPAFPYLRTAGAQTLTTNPDGMYAFVHHAHGFADVIAIEICRNNQNLNDKRARYAPTTATNQLVPLQLARVLHHHYKGPHEKALGRIRLVRCETCDRGRPHCPAPSSLVCSYGQRLQ